MSRSRTAERLRRYSLCPDRESRRVTTTSWYASGSVPSELSNTSDTSATLTGRRPVEPWKITSSIFPPRSKRGDCSPSTQRTASETFDLPAVWSDDRSHALIERQLHQSGEGLESRELEPAQSHGIPIRGSRFARTPARLSAACVYAACSGA